MSPQASFPLKSGSGGHSQTAHQDVIPVLASSFWPPGDDPAALTLVGFARALLGKRAAGVMIDEQVQFAHRFRDRDKTEPLVAECGPAWDAGQCLGG